MVGIVQVPAAQWVKGLDLSSKFLDCRLLKLKPHSAELGSDRTIVYSVCCTAACVFLQQIEFVVDRTEQFFRVDKRIRRLAANFLECVQIAARFFVTGKRDLQT